MCVGVVVVVGVAIGVGVGVGVCTYTHAQYKIAKEIVEESVDFAFAMSQACVCV